MTCLVAGCERSTTKLQPLPEGMEWICHDGEVPEWLCGVHWPRVPKAWKRRLRRLEREHLKAIAPETVDLHRADMTQRLARKMWDRMKALFDEGHLDMDEITRIIGP